MNKLLCTAAVMAALSVPAMAEDMKVKPYVGFDLQRSVFSYNNNYDLGGGAVLDGDAILEDGLDGANIHVGARLHKNFGVEFGYFRTRDENRNIGAADIIGTIGGVPAAAGADFSTSVQIQGITLDGMGYLPLDDRQRFELIGTAGLMWSKADVELTVPGIGSDNVDESEIGFRIGGGAQFNITDNVNVRGLARYQTADYDDVADHAFTYSLGLNFSF